MISVLLIGRGSSQGFPGKNVYPVLNKPLMIYPLTAALNSTLVENLYVSTDSDEIKRIAREAGALIIDRPPHLCTSQALGEDVFAHGYQEIKKLNPGKEIELMVLLFCNAPMVTPELIEEGIKVLRDHREYDSAVSVSKYNMWSPLRARKIEEDGLLHPFIPFEIFDGINKLSCDRDSQGDVWFADMGVSVVRPRCLENLKEGLLPQRWMGKKIYPLKQWGGLDVDYEWQIPQAAFWLQKNGLKKKKNG